MIPKEICCKSATNNILSLNLTKEALNQGQEGTCMRYSLLLNLLMGPEGTLHSEFIPKNKKPFKLMSVVQITVGSLRKLIFLNLIQEQLLGQLFTF